MPVKCHRKRNVSFCVHMSNAPLHLHFQKVFRFSFSVFFPFNPSNQEKMNTHIYTYLFDLGVTISLVSDVYFLSARPPLKSSTVSLVTVSSRGSPPLLPLLKVLWSVLRTITTLDRGWLNSWPCIVGGIIANDCERGPPTRGDLEQIRKGNEGIRFELKNTFYPYDSFRGRILLFLLEFFLEGDSI